MLSVQATSAGILGNVLTLTLNRPVSTANFFDFQYGGASRVKVTDNSPLDAYHRFQSLVTETEAPGSARCCELL